MLWKSIFELQPDLVLMDITMPNMDGLEALKAIRAKDNKANVVMCSAMGQEAMVVEAVQAGIKDFIVKPFKEDRLMKTVNSILGNPLTGAGQCRKCFWTICAILGVLVLAYLFTRYVAGRGQGGGPSRLGKRMLTILDQVAVGKDQKAPPGPRGRNVLFPGVTQGASPVWKSSLPRRPRPGWSRRRRRAQDGGSRKRCTACWSSGNNRGGHNRWMR